MTNEERYLNAVQNGSKRPSFNHLNPGETEDFYFKYGYKPNAPGYVGYANTYGTDHAGIFSPNNPYLLNLQNAVGADKDALYELAVKWEADNATLQEQRAYDDPMAQAQRLRKAGINPDIVGSSGSPGTSAGSSATLGEQDNTSSFGDTYREEELSLQRKQLFIDSINAVTNVAGSIANVATSATSIFDTLSTLPSRISLAESQAFVADKTKDAAVSSAGLSNSSQMLGNIQDSLSLLNGLSGFFTKDSTDEEIGNTLSTLGVPVEQVGPLTQGIRQWYSNPVYQAQYADAVKRKNETEAYNNAYTPQFLARSMQMAVEIQDVNNALTLSNAHFESQIATVINTPENAQLFASNEILSKRYEGDFTRFQHRILRHNSEAFINQLSAVKAAYDHSQNLENHIISKAKMRGRDDKGDYLFTPEERSIIKVEQAKRAELAGLGANSLSRAYSFINHTNANYYYNDALLSDGVPLPDKITSNKHTFMRHTFTFADYLNNSCNNGDLVDDLTKLGQVAVGASLVVK